MSLYFRSPPSRIVVCPDCRYGRIGCRPCDRCHGHGWLEVPVAVDAPDQGWDPWDPSASRAGGGPSGGPSLSE